MTLGEKIKEQRTAHSLSQETLAEQMGVSRQAVTKWEADQSTPSSEKLIALAKLFQIPLDELISNDVTRSEAPQGKKPNPILRANLTRIAIICHLGVGFSTAQHYYNYRVHEPDPGIFIAFVLSLVILFLCSIWMAFNHRFEADIQQRKKNTQIELLYCLVQLGIAFLVIYAGIGLVGALLMLIVGMVYILVINPKYMNRKLTK